MLLALAGVALLALLAACSSTTTTPTASTTPASDATGSTVADRPLVAVATPLVGALVRSVAGDQVAVRLLDPADAGPGALDGVDLVVQVDGGGSQPRGSAPGAADPLVLAPELNPIPLGGSELDPTSAAGAGATDPHVWLDPDRWTQAARLVAERLGALPGIDRAGLDANVAAFDAAVSRADETLQATFATVGDQRTALVSDLPALAYLTDRYGFDLVLADGAAALAAAARAERSPAVFVAPGQQAARSTELAAEVPTVAVVGLDLEGAGLAAALDGSAEQATVAYTDLLVTAGATLVAALAR